MAKENEIERLEREYNEALEERDAARERAVQAKRALDQALEAQRADAIDMAGRGAGNAEVRTALVTEEN